MFIVRLDSVADLSEIDAALDDHVDWLTSFGGPLDVEAVREALG